jgi:hypothetical protein
LKSTGSSEPFRMSSVPRVLFLTSRPLSVPFLTFAPVISAPATAVPVREKTSATIAMIVAGLKVRILLMAPPWSRGSGDPMPFKPGSRRFLTRDARSRGCGRAVRRRRSSTRGRGRAPAGGDRCGPSAGTPCARSDPRRRRTSHAEHRAVRSTRDRPRRAGGGPTRSASRTSLSSGRVSSRGRTSAPSSPSRRRSPCG